MSVEFIAAATVRALAEQVHAARQRAVDAGGPPPAAADAAYWERVFEANAAEALAVLPLVTLAPGYVVRYRYFGRNGQDLLVRPFVAQATTDVQAVKRVLDWHAPPDSVAPQLADAPTQDVQLLYRHFSFPHTAVGYFEYWLAMQELWASQRWAHSHLIASAAELSQITAADGWEVLHPVQAYEPAVVRQPDGGARLAVLIECPLRRFEIQLHQIDVAADHSLRWGEPVLVAAGPRGYIS